MSLSHDVIVCVHNSLDDVIECLRSIIKFRPNNVHGQIIVINDNSNTNTRLAIENICSAHRNMTLINLSTQNYYTKAANIGLKNSKSNIKTLLNSDTIVTEGWEEKIISSFSMNSNLGILGPLSNAASTQSVPFINGSTNQTAINFLPPNVNIEEFSKVIKSTARNLQYPIVPLVHGFSFSINSRVIETIGYLDEDNFPRGYGEENDYCFRADDAGFILKIAIDIFIYHKKSKSYNDNERISFMKSGMNSLVNKYGARRIDYSVNYMKNNPTLKFMRNAIQEKWPNFYIA